jgi:hypothetical protein
MPKKAIYILLALIVTFYVIGNIHSHYKHAEDNNNPFLMAYRGVEFFWHADLTEAEWTEQLKNDTQAVFNLIANATTHERNSDEQERKIKTLRNQIKSYPKDKILYLKKAGTFYMTYDSSLDRDLMKRIIGDTMYYTPDFLSGRTKTLMDSVSKYQKVNQTKSLTKAINEVWGNKDSIIPLNPNAKNI